jgi:hypothetical protein
LRLGRRKHPLKLITHSHQKKMARPRGVDC